MAITSVKTGSSFTSLIKYDSLLAGNAYYVPPSFESIATVTLSTASSTISFSSIPATYKSLQLRVMNVGSGAANGYVRVNGDTTAANYTAHILRGTGSAATATGYAGGGYSDGLILFEGTVATYPTVAIMDIIDYASTTKNKTARCFAGNDNNSTGGTVWLTAALWMNTSAINALVIATGSGSFSIGTTAALYGIKGA